MQICAKLICREALGVISNLEAYIEHLVDEAFLGQAKLLHQISRDVGCQLEGKVTFLMTIVSDSLDS